MKRLVIAALALTLAVPAHAFLARNDLVVRPTGQADFTIPYRGKSGASDFWCAAGDYVIRSLNLSPTTRIWRTTEPPRRSGEGIDFSLSADRAASSSGLAMFGGDGRSLTAAHAQSLCETGRWFVFD